MKNFSNNRSGGNRGGFRSGGRDSFPKEMFRATCSECGKGCEVPFRPTGEKPVYCSNCFGARREGGDVRGGDRFAKKSFGDRGPRRDFHDRSARPAYDSAPRAAGSDEVKRSLDQISIKLDQLIRSIDQMSRAGATPAKKESVPEFKVVSAKKPTKKAAPKKVVAKAKKK